MKSTIYISVIALATLGLASCNDDFLDRYPTTQITEPAFFKTASDLELYSNHFYDYFSFFGSNMFGLSTPNDFPSDNMLNPSFSGELFQMMTGGIVPGNAPQWNWRMIREVNFMIARDGNATGTNADHFRGVARMTRACLYYYSKVLRFSAVPWYSRDLQTTDEEPLYKTQDSRALIVDSIMADFDYALKTMEVGEDRTLFSRDVALGYLARTALYEASWRKYHPELGLSDADKYYQKAIAACEELMKSGSFVLSPDYAALFRNNDLKGNKEIIFYQDFNLGDPNKIWWNGLWSSAGMMTRDLMESYLSIKDDKAVPFTSTASYETKSFGEFYKDRDPRLVATFWTPGFQRYGYNSLEVPDLSKGGYGIKKFEPSASNQEGFGSSSKCYIDLALMRYGEILLIYAEAKAELGQLTQNDLDKSINLLRDRAKVPRASLADWLTNTDPVLVAKYPNVQSSQKNAVLEVRRERRVELACEGFRPDDLKRWACGKEFAVMPEGIYFPGYGLYDMNEDGNPDVLIVAKNEDKANYQDALNKYAILSYAVEDGNIKLSNGNSGFVMPAGKDGIYKFQEPRDYYFPISQQDMTINPNLVQNPFWK